MKVALFCILGYVIGTVVTVVALFFTSCLHVDDDPEELP